MNQARIIPVGEELPPMDADEPRRNGAGPRRNKAKGKTASAKRRTGERFALLNAFVDFSMGGLSRAEIIVWMILYRDSKEGIASTAQTDVARRGNIDRRTVGRSLRRLTARGLLEIVRQGGFRRGVSRYRVRGLKADFQGT